MILYPWLEQWITGDHNEHHILDRPRNQPVRTGIGVAFITFYILLWIAGGNDFFATIFEIPVNWITWFMRFAVIILPPVMFWATKRVCISLQRRDRDKVLHGRETGVIMVSPEGEYSKSAISQVAAYELTAHRRQVPVQRTGNGRERNPGTTPANRRSAPGSRRSTSATWCRSRRPASSSWHIMTGTATGSRTAMARQTARLDAAGGGGKGQPDPRSRTLSHLHLRVGPV